MLSGDKRPGHPAAQGDGRPGHPAAQGDGRPSYPAAPSDRWLGHRADPVVRPYALTGGRTEPAGGAILDLLAVIVATDGPAGAATPMALGPEHRRILALCQRPVTLADVAAGIALPVGVVRVLLADLILLGLISARPPSTPGAANADLLKEVLHGLRAL
jgi:Protein of unknown function (DUF742)